ncbi:MAG: hypothetical protein MK135_12845 [Polyangiaceae bacterium]|nr:hypothetical protein [Polyangiaceae bacterium]
MQNFGPRWLFPALIVGYSSLAAMPGQAWWIQLYLLSLPVALLFLARRFALGLKTVSKAHCLDLYWVLSAISLYLVTFTSSLNLNLELTLTLALGLASTATLSALEHTDRAQGLILANPVSRTRDALVFNWLIWSFISASLALKALFPRALDIDQRFLHLGVTFGAFASFLLIFAALLRGAHQRGLELGAGERIRAALSMAFAGVLLATAVSLLKPASLDRIFTLSLLVECLGITAALSLLRAQQIAQMMRRLLALIVFALPTFLLGRTLLFKAALLPDVERIIVAAVSIVLTLLSWSLARRMGPQNGRWFFAIKKAQLSSLQPEPEQALSAALQDLRQTEPQAKSQPTLFSYAEKQRFEVNVAEWLETIAADFPDAIFELARQEPYRALRLNVLEKIQVQRPEIRPAVSWFQANEALVAIALEEKEEKIGLLVLPRGGRVPPLEVEEIEALSTLGERMAGRLSIRWALQRAQRREQRTRAAMNQEKDRTRTLQAALLQGEEQEKEFAEELAAPLLATALGPDSNTLLDQLSLAAKSGALCLQVPGGVNGKSWAAALHLRIKTNSRLIFFQGAELEELALQPATAEPSQLELNNQIKSARAATVVVESRSRLTTHQHRQIKNLLAGAEPNLLIYLTPRASEYSQLTNVESSVVPSFDLPHLVERSDDLQAMIIYELSQQAESPDQAIGLERAAFEFLLNYDFPGNEAELRGILIRGINQSRGDKIALEHLFPTTPQALSLEQPSSASPTSPRRRGRGRLPPRARR